MAALNTLAGYIDWVSLNHITAENCKLVETLCLLLNEQELQLGAAECLLIAVSRKVSKQFALVPRSTCGGKRMRAHPGSRRADRSRKLREVEARRGYIFWKAPPPYLILCTSKLHLLKFSHLPQAVPPTWDHLLRYLSGRSTCLFTPLYIKPICLSLVFPFSCVLNYN